MIKAAPPAVEIAEVYCDGATIGYNPSRVGGAWASCWVDADGKRVRSRSGKVTPDSDNLDVITCNYAELLAAVNALCDLPDGWAGTIYTDSEVTYWRIRQSPRQSALNGITALLAARLANVKARLGNYRTVVVKGHPTTDELRRGVSRKGRPVSVHNVHCDKLCVALGGW